MKKFVLILLIFVIFISACQKISEPERGATVNQLSDLHITACAIANDAGTCDTRLPEIGIVQKEDCCKALGKCC